ncbi:MAG: hypothetical protein JXR76_02410 [Deltaproteobacteria bacterium]|nr:hypothetical protein [Deltaproteobacteria bacterium]
MWLYKSNHSQPVRRPDVYFQKDGTMPEIAVLKLYLPVSHENIRPNAFEKLIFEDIARQEKEIADEMRKNGHTFMEMDAVLKQSHKEKPQSLEERQSMNPKFFALDKQGNRKVEIDRKKL